MTITVISGDTNKEYKEWIDTNFSGCYHMVEIVNDRPAYKVSFCSWQETLARKGLLLLNFSEMKRLGANGLALKYISGIKIQKRIGVWQMSQISKLEITIAACTSNLKVSKNSLYIWNESSSEILFIDNLSLKLQIF